MALNWSSSIRWQNNFKMAKGNNSSSKRSHKKGKSLTFRTPKELRLLKLKRNDGQHAVSLTPASTPNSTQVTPSVKRTKNVRKSPSKINGLLIPEAASTNSQISPITTTQTKDDKFADKTRSKEVTDMLYLGVDCIKLLSTF